jgi:hypothetical protein
LSDRQSTSSGQRPQPKPARPTISASEIEECAKKAVGKGNRWLSDGWETSCERMAASISEQAGRLGQSVGHSVLGKAEEDAKRFLKHLPEARAEIRALYRSSVEGTDAIPEKNLHFDGLVQLDLSEMALRSLLERYGGRKARQYAWQDLAGWISVHCPLQNSSGRPPRSVNPDEPLCVYVRLVLETLGEKHSGEAVSGVLRMRRGPGRKKKGKTSSKNRL